MPEATFPPDFVWGAATDVATDHRWPEDVTLMRELGLDTYRLSISWARLQPGGRGPLDPAGVASYRRLLTALREAGIDPVLTLNHRDLPAKLENAGGWTDRATAEAFADYARVTARALGDLVALWITLDEPWSSAFLGDAAGVHASGRREPAAALAAAHHLNVAHGLAARAIREVLGDDARVGVSLDLTVTWPADPERAADLEAAHEIDLAGNHVLLGPLLEGTYPAELKAQTARLTNWSFVRPGDLLTTRQRLDALGVNLCATRYARRTAAGGQGDAPAGAWLGADLVELTTAAGPPPATGTNVGLEGLTELLTALSLAHDDLPLFATGDGAASEDTVAEDGAVHDPERVRYLADHVSAVARARQAGADVRGYFVRPLMDDVERASGHARRRGLVRVDRDTLVRTPKDSFWWYAALTRTGAVPGR